MKMKKLLCLVLSLLLVLSLAACGGKETKRSGNSAKTAIEQYLDACIKGDYMAISNMQPKEVIDAIKANNDMDDDDWDEQIEQNQEIIENYFEILEGNYGGKPKITYEIVDQRSLDDKDDAFEEIQYKYEYYYDIEISDVKAFDVELTMMAGGEMYKNTTTLHAVKINSSWYPCKFNSISFF